MWIVKLKFRFRPRNNKGVADLYLQFQVQIPEKLTEKQKSLFEELKEIS